MKDEVFVLMEQGAAYSMQANEHHNKNEFDKAIEFYTKAKEIYQKCEGFTIMADSQQLMIEKCLEEQKIKEQLKKDDSKSSSTFNILGGFHPDFPLGHPQYAERIKEQLQPRYPTDAEEIQRLLREAQGVAVDIIDPQHQAAYEEHIAKKTLAGCIKGAAKEVAACKATQVNNPKKILVAAVKGCVKDSFSGLRDGVFNEIIKYQEYLTSVFRKEAEKVVDNSYITPASREKAIDLLIERYREIHEQKTQESHGKKRKRSPSPRPL